MLFELEHHKEEERRFVRLLMHFFLPRQTWRNMQSVADNSGERGMRAASLAPSMWMYMSIPGEYMLCKSIPYINFFFNVRIQIEKELLSLNITKMMSVV